MALRKPSRASAQATLLPTPRTFRLALAQMPVRGGAGRGAGRAAPRGRWSGVDLSTGPAAGWACRVPARGDQLFVHTLPVGW